MRAGGSATPPRKLDLPGGENGVGFVLDDVQDSWARRLSQYPRAELVLFSNSTRTACGFGDAATGPFYCPADGKVYLGDEDGDIAVIEHGRISEYGTHEELLDRNGLYAKLFHLQAEGYR